MKNITSKIIRGITTTVNCTIYNIDVTNNSICFKAFNQKNIDNDAECIDISNTLITMGFNAIYLGYNNIKINNVQFDNPNILVKKLDYKHIFFTEDKQLVNIFNTDKIRFILNDYIINKSIVNYTDVIFSIYGNIDDAVFKLIKHGYDASKVLNSIRIKNIITIDDNTQVNDIFDISQLNVNDIFKTDYNNIIHVITNITNKKNTVYLYTNNKYKFIYDKINKVFILDYQKYNSPIVRIMKNNNLKINQL